VKEPRSTVVLSFLEEIRVKRSLWSARRDRRSSFPTLMKIREFC